MNGQHILLHLFNSKHFSSLDICYTARNVSILHTISAFFKEMSLEECILPLQARFNKIYISYKHQQQDTWALTTTRSCLVVSLWSRKLIMQEPHDLEFCCSHQWGNGLLIYINLSMSWLFLVQFLRKSF